MYPYTTIDPQAFANEQAMLQQRINQLEQARNQQITDSQKELNEKYKKRMKGIEVE